jgi:hypothetical protein
LNFYTWDVCLGFLPAGAHCVITSKTHTRRGGRGLRAANETDMVSVRTESGFMSAEEVKTES